jgi:DDE domain
VDETYLKVRGRWAYLYRAIDRHGHLVDTMLSEHRDMAAAQAFFRSAKTASPPASIMPLGWVRSRFGPRSATWLLQHKPHNNAVLDAAIFPVLDQQLDYALLAPPSRR